MLPFRCPRYTLSMSTFSVLARVATASALIALLATPQAHAWGRDGHMMINKLAAQNLPDDVPYFLRNGNGVDIMEWMGPEPDRWKQRDAEPELVATQSPDHFLDYEWAVYGATKCEAGTTDCVAGYKCPRKRYDFIRAMSAALPQHPEIKTAETVGFQPWQVEEVWERLKSDMREYRKAVAAKQDTAPVQLAILFDAGWLGHYVGDGSQPLHITIQYNGWTGPNPNGYAVFDKQNGIHSKFESVFVSANVKPDTDVAPLVAATKPMDITDEWVQYFEYIEHSNSLVEKTYQLDKTKAFDGAGTPEGKAFVDERLAAGAIELRDLIYSAWLHSADPVQEYHGPQ
jgi:hypothetical protein